jgi:Pyruvate/2-oxoacid:ferredoxin oxidoreductase gamma subunit
MALNEPSLQKFLPAVEPGGWVLYNGTSLPEGVLRKDVKFIVQPFVSLADRIGDAKAGNMVMLGAMLAATNLLDGQWIDNALQRLVKSERWLDLDRRAIECGREFVQKVLRI